MSNTINTNTDTKKARFFEISLLNVFFCMLVIFIHVSSKPVTSLDKNAWQYFAVMIPWRLSGFVVQGFIFLSGLKLFLNKSNGFVYHKFLFKRFFSIILPYIAWVFVYYIYFCMNNYFPFRITDLIKYIFFGNLVSHFYFIIIIAQFYILLPLFIKLTKKTNPVILILFALMATIILGQNLPNVIDIFIPDYYFKYNDRIFTTYLIYWILGCYAGLYYEKFKDILSENRIIISVIFCVSSIGDGFLSYLNFGGKKSIHWLENVHVMYCLSAIIFFYMIAVCFTNKRQFNRETLVIKFLKNVDKTSYGIYLSHILVIFIVDNYLAEYNIKSIGISYLIRICAVYTFTIGILLIWRSIKEALGKKLPFRAK